MFVGEDDLVNEVDSVADLEGLPRRRKFFFDGRDVILRMEVIREWRAFRKLRRVK